ncbi:MAG: bifunctional 3,4-dihydroxy-2-butanone-4-phosphate synthase/GTP cyclohydrolase II [Dehalococcoidia bacterium]|nr:bifunctional 3,4-dihydroxy-2-butanone-4-phosphate synthase/GTP cyclohydrolase II [Dehalococcoidia bacterium]
MATSKAGWKPAQDPASSSALISVPEAMERMRQGRMLVIVDDEDRENEGDVCIAGQFCTPDAINFMAMHARGLICVPMRGDFLDRLDLPPMTTVNSSRFGTAFTVSVEAATGVTTGISAADRARTVAVLADPSSQPHDLTRPGHVFPLRAREGGVLVRTGQTEASVDLCQLAGLTPVAVVCEVIKDDGTMARMPDLERFARKHEIGIVTVADIITYRLRHDRLIERVEEAKLPTEFGDFRAIAYRTLIDAKEHLALVLGDLTTDEPVLVRVHDQCLTGDVFNSLRCDCGQQLRAAMHLLATEGRGAIVYMDQEGRGIGLCNKIRAYHLQDQGLDTVEANEMLGLPVEGREYGIGAQILLDLGIRKLRLMTNNPAKIREIATFGNLRSAGLDGFGLEVVERVPLEMPANPHNVDYLITKRDKMGHILDQDM